MVDPARRDAGAEAVVDVDDRETGGARVQHREQRGDAAEARAVADARRHGDDRLVDEPADDARQRALHAGDDDQHPRRAETVATVEEAMDAGDTYVVETL